MPQCKNCGSHVSSSFQEVLSADDKVYACPSCSANAGIAEVSERRRNVFGDNNEQNEREIGTRFDIDKLQD